MSADSELFGDALPTYLSRFVGRTGEVAAVRTLCRDASLVTVCGVGGIGKTRLAIEVARELRSDPWPLRAFDEVVWAPLVAVSESSAVPAAVAAGLGIHVPTDTGASLAVVNALRGRRCLLVLDNAEQVADGCRDLVETIARSGVDVLVLVTSRVALQAAGERVYAVPTMTDDATALFVDRARSVAPAYALTGLNADAISSICRRVGGLPLAVELTASWVRALSPLDLLGQLDATLHAASPDDRVADRHRDLDTVIAGTWRWLGEHERAVATALGVFRGGFTREAAEQVAGATLTSLATLTERAVLQRLPDRSGGSRYQLHELVRTFALRSLAAGPENETVRSRHLDYFLTLARGLDTPEHTLLEPTLGGPAADERGNLDAALDWALSKGDAAEVLRIVDVLHGFYCYSQPTTAQRVAQLERVLALVEDDPSREGRLMRGRALNRFGYTLLDDRPQEARDQFERARQVFCSLHNPVGIAVSHRGLSWVELTSGDLRKAALHNRLSLRTTRRSGDELGEAWSLHDLGIVADLRGDAGSAVRQLRQAFALFERQQGLYGMYRTSFRIGEACRRARRWSEALDGYRTTLAITDTEHFTTEGGDLLEGLGRLAAALGEPVDAGRLLGAAQTWRTVYDEAPRILVPWDEDVVGPGLRPLGASGWGAAVADGSRLTGEQAFRLAHAVLDRLTETLAPRPAGLTDREIDILRLVALGLSSTQIAERLVLSPRTVHAHLRSIFGKLDVTTRTAAAHEAQRLHLV